MIIIEDVTINNLSKSIKYLGLSYNTDGSQKTALKLANKESCAGHDSFLKGVTVNFLLTAPHYFIIELQRYHFLDIVMSQSKMHSLKEWGFIEKGLPVEVDNKIKKAIRNLWENYFELKDECSFRKLLANLPLGMNLTMYITTNYLQLKNIYYQRKKHKLQEWRSFCKWIERLEFLKEVL